METRNAIISDTKLGGYDDAIPSEKGIFTGWVYLDFSGSGIGFGGFRLGETYTHKFVMRVLEVLEVPNWEKLKGTSVRVKMDGYSGPVLAIGHFLKDKWFEPRKEWELED